MLSQLLRNMEHKKLIITEWHPNINSSLDCSAQPVDPDEEENLEISYIWRNVTQGMK